MENHTKVTPEMQATNNTLTLTVYRKMHDEQRRLLLDLEELYALVNVCRIALKDKGQDETDSTSAVLMLAVNHLFDLSEAQAEREKQLEAIAYPELDPDEAFEHARQAVQKCAEELGAKIMARDIQTLRGLLAEMRRIYQDPQGFGDIHGMLDEAYELADQLRARVSMGAV